jgi:TonB family protein
MKRNKKHIKDLEKILDYTGGLMTGRHRNRFEKDLQKDQFESDAAEGLSAISREEALQDMKELNINLSARASKSNRIIYFRAAAAVAAILAVGTIIILLTSDLNQVFQRAAVTQNSQSDNENIINGVEKSEQVISEESHTKTEAPAQNIPTARSKESVTISEPADAVSISENSKENKKQMVIEAEEEITAIPETKAARSETYDAGKIVTRKYVDNYVRGVVISSEDKLPLPGATVKIRGTTAGTYTDKNGNFELPVQPGTEITLVAEYIGMEQNEVNLDNVEEVQITLDPSVAALDEVVVVGYGVQEKSKITGAVSTIEMDDSPDWQLPSPVDGTRKYKEYIKDNLRYPSDAAAYERAVVVLNFIVAENGRPKNISVLKSPGKSYSEEAIRLLVSGPDWYPARRNGEIIEEETMIRIVFRQDYE